MHLTPELIADLRKIINYNWEAEQTDYNREGPEANDVFPALQRLNNALTTAPDVTPEISYAVQLHDIHTLTAPMWDACGIECPKMIGASCPADEPHFRGTCPGWSAKYPSAAAEVVDGWSLDAQPEVVGDTEQPIGWNARFDIGAGDDINGPMGAGLILHTNDRGAVTLTRFETVSGLDGVWSALQEEEAKYDRANCVECTDDGPCWNHDDDDDDGTPAHCPAPHDHSRAGHFCNMTGDMR